MKDFSDDFNEFWKLWPCRWVSSSGKWVKLGKFKAWEQWRRLSKFERAWTLAIVKKVPKGKYVPDAFRWLRDKGFMDYDNPATELVGQVAAPVAKLAERIGKPVPQPDTRSVSDKANEQKNKLGVR